MRLNTLHSTLLLAAVLYAFGSIITGGTHPCSYHYETAVPLALALPSTPQLVAMLSDPDDLPQNEEAAYGPMATLYYRRIARLVPAWRERRTHFEQSLQRAWQLHKKWHPSIRSVQVQEAVRAWRGDVTLPGISSLPRLDQLDASHTYALDIFYKNVTHHGLSGSTERGPMVFALSDGIVVAVAEGWTGFPRIDQKLGYLWGGISPKSGNGVILYAPEERRYYSYFHLSDVHVLPGMVVKRGMPLGLGGNTGLNARREGRGEHLHLEIFDAQRGRYMDNRHILQLLKLSAQQAAGSRGRPFQL
ncbi:MAG: M23 family metallopeptidase [Spirochaetales bacterium]|nr:M23 family metallopeptidase [Spirochaetales bacterium]